MAEPVYIVKTQGGATGVKRTSVKTAFAYAVLNAPARVYRLERTNVLLGTTEADGRLHFTSEGERAALAEVESLVT